jgi:hypothetical protein
MIDEECECNTPPPWRDYQEDDEWICTDCGKLWQLKYVCISGPIYIWMTKD